MEVKFNLLCLPVQVFDLVLRSVNNPWYVWGCTESGTFPWGHTRGWRVVFFSSGPRWPFFTSLISALGRLVYMIFRNMGFPGCSGTEFLECAFFSNGSVCHSSHHWGAFVQRNVFKWLLNAAQSLHQDLMSSSPPGCCNRCREASIEPFVTLDNLLPSRFIRTVTIQPSSCASLASADCFPARALAYVPTTHLLFHRQWQVGTSWGTVMTDPPCLSSADGVNHGDRHFCFVAKSKNKLYVSRSVRSATNSQRYNKSLVYLMWTAHQAIINPSSRPSLNLFISLSPKRRRKIYLSRAARAVGFWDGLNWRPHHSIFIKHSWQGELVGLGHCIMNTFDNMQKSQTKSFWARTRKRIFTGGKHDTAESTNYVICHGVLLIENAALGENVKELTRPVHLKVPHSDLQTDKTQ